MKHFLFVLAIFSVLLFGFFAVLPQPFALDVQRLGCLPSCATVQIFCRATSAPAIDAGNGYLLQCPLQQLSQTLKLCNGIDGISVKFEGTLQDFVTLQQRLKMETNSCLSWDGLTVVCGYSPLFCGGVTVDGKFVNLQMAFDGTTVTIGSPLILDSY